MRIDRRTLLAYGAGAAVSLAPPQAFAKRTNRVRMALTNMPRVLDPRFATDATSARVNRLLYVTPVSFDARFLAAPGLCEFEQLDSLRWRLRVQSEAALFSTGRAVTAADVKATYDSVLDEGTASPHRGSIKHIVGLDSESPSSLVIRLAKPDALLPGKLVVGVLPAELLASGHDFNTAPVGSGPFEYRDRVDQARVVLQRRRDALTLEFERVSDPTVRVLKLLRGEVDLLQNDVPPEVVRWLENRAKDRGGARVSRGPGSNFAYVGFNMADAVTGDLRVRQAVALGLDRDAIIKYLLGGGARLSTAILAPGHWASAPDLSPIRRNLARARRLVAELGHDAGNPLPLVYKTSSDPFRLRLATVMQAQLREANIALELRSYDWGTFYGDIKAGNFQMFSLAWVGVKLPDIYRYTLHSESVPPAGANRGRYHSAEADRLIDAAEAGETLQAQATHYRALQRVLLEDLPYVPLWHEDHMVASVSHVTGYRIAPDGGWDALADVEIDG